MMMTLSHASSLVISHWRSEFEFPTTPFFDLIIFSVLLTCSSHHSRSAFWVTAFSRLLSVFYVMEQKFFHGWMSCWHCTSVSFDQALSILGYSMILKLRLLYLTLLCARKLNKSGSIIFCDYAVGNDADRFNAINALVGNAESFVNTSKTACLH